VAVCGYAKEINDRLLYCEQHLEEMGITDL